MNILVFGASGRTGSEIVRQALAQRHHVAAFVRDPARLPVVHPDLEFVRGDVADNGAVGRAVAGRDAVLSALGAQSPFRFDGTVVEGIRHVVAAMEREGVRRLVYLSAINVSESRKYAGPVIRLVAPVLLRSETAGHEARERIIRESGLDWTLVRSAGLTNGAPRGVYRSGEQVSAAGPAATIARADVADFMLRQLSDTAYLRKSPIVMY
jgi:putative NADH-flavin reductase